MVTEREIRCVHIVPRVSEQASGPSYSVPTLCDALADAKLSVALWTLDSVPSHARRFEGRAFPSIPLLPALGISSALRRALIAGASEHDVYHNHSLWMLPNIYPGSARLASSSLRLVMAPRGTLSPYALARSALRKRLVWYGGQRNALTAADAFHATSALEQEEIRALGFRQPIAVIPNGVDIPPLRYSGAPSPRRLLFLARIHPKKGLEMLLRAWALLQCDFRDWQLEVVGPDNVGHMNDMRWLAASLGLERVVFRGALFGSAKEEAYQRAELYVLPTHSENFGLSVAEALANGTPVITTHGAPWSGLVRHGCGWWIERSLPALTETLRTGMSKSPEDLRRMGENGRRWVEREFSWRGVAAHMAEFYRWLVAGGAAPDFVHAS